MSDVCADRYPCVEVVARLQAADRAEYVEGCPEHADNLRATADRIACVHRAERELVR